MVKNHVSWPLENKNALLKYVNNLRFISTKSIISSVYLTIKKDPLYIQTLVE